MMNSMKNSNLKSKRGITLIALVITIIVLLILAGVMVATLTGENGLLSKSQLAKERTTEGEQDEKDKLSSYENELGNYSTMPRTGGTGVSGVTTTKLWDTTGSSTSGKITLEDDYTNYKCIVLTACIQESGPSYRGFTSITLMKDDIVTYDGRSDKYEIDGYDTRYINFYFEDTKTIVISAYDRLGLRSIYGIN